MQVSTIDSEQVWQSPDGTKKIWEVAVRTPDEKTYRVKTYSPYISQQGFEGDVESYEKRGERFVRQLHKDQQPAKVSPYARDDDAIRAQWAIGQAINLTSVKMEKDAITMPVIERYARELFATVSRVKGETLTAERETAAAEQIQKFTQTAATF